MSEILKRLKTDGSRDKPTDDVRLVYDLMLKYKIELVEKTAGSSFTSKGLYMPLYKYWLVYLPGSAEGWYWQVEAVVFKCLFDFQLIRLDTVSPDYGEAAYVAAPWPDKLPERKTIW